MACVLKGSQFYLHTPRSSANGINPTVFAFPAEAGTHLPTPKGWKAELANLCCLVARKRALTGTGPFWQTAIMANK